MNDGFKQRLVGAVVLLCLALIFWPWFFSDAERLTTDKTSQIPLMPAFEKYTVASPIRPADIEPVVTPQDKPTPAQPVPAKSTIEAVAEIKQKAAAVKPSAIKPNIVKQAKPTLDSHNLPEAWVLQVASFVEASNARVLKQDLIKQGYKAYTRSIKTKNSISTRVYIGPRLTKDAFDKISININKTYNVNAIVVRYEQ